MNESHESTKPGFGENIDRLIIYEEETLFINIMTNYDCGDLMLMVCVNNHGTSLSILNWRY